MVKVGLKQTSTADLVERSSEDNLSNLGCVLVLVRLQRNFNLLLVGPFRGAIDEWHTAQPRAIRIG